MSQKLSEPEKKIVRHACYCKPINDVVKQEITFSIWPPKAFGDSQNPAKPSIKGR